MRSRIILQLILFTFSLSAIGQVPDTLSKPKIFRLPKSEHSFDFAFRFPVGAFGDKFQPSSSSSSGGIIESIEGTKGGMGADMGYEFGLTGNYYFDKSPSNLNTGLRITYFSFSSIPFAWKANGEYILNDADFSNLDFLSFKAGIVIRTALAEQKSLVFYDQLCFAYCWNGGFIYDSNDGNNYSQVSDQAQLEMHSGMGLRDELGISFRTHHFVSSFGFSFGKITFNEAHYNRDLSAPGYLPANYELDFKASMPTSTLFLSVGLGF